MEELQKIKIEMKVTNQYGDIFSIYQEVDEEYGDDNFTEIDIYHNAYLNFLKTAGFCFNLNDRVVVLKENEYIETYCDDDCENCDGCEQDNNEELLDALKNYSKEIADIVVEEFLKTSKNTGYYGVI